MIVVEYFVQFFLISLSILAISLPFVGLFFYKHRKQILSVRPHFNQFMENFFDSRYASYLVLVWAMLEALVWFVIPEFLLLLLIFMRKRRKTDLLLFDIAGTVIGTVIGFVIHLSPSALVTIPYVYSSMIEQTRVWYEHEGIFGLIHQPFSGVPYKVFVALAPDFHLFPIWFILFALVVRLSRYVLFYGAFRALYPLLHRIVYKNYAILLVIAVAIFTAMLMKVSGTYMSGYIVTGR